ncbi:MAG: acetolactate synthase small subunit [Acutalibacteraceae bacterium]|nr:acetolactate synthase small subunit [Acutalibacteraceae bacterium]
MNRYTVAVLVRNQFGVLNRVTSMFRRRQFNISALTVSETESTEFSRITVLFDGDETNKQQLINQLYKLPDVCSIKELNKTDSVNVELLLIKIENSPENREAVFAAATAFEAKTVDYAKDSIIFQLTADAGRIDNFIDLMRDFEILEICRTGIVSLERGNETIRKVTNY